VSAVRISIDACLEKAQVIFFDFDGVIKESIPVKSDAFEELFLPYGVSTAKRVRNHHEENGGMSRYEKIPLYLKWSGLDPSRENIDRFSDNFSKIVKNRVIKSEWVEPVKRYLDSFYNSKVFILVTATPEDEILEIVEKLGIRGYFHEVHGSPKSKVEVLQNVIKQMGVDPAQTYMVGDSVHDYAAAISNDVPFLLRHTNYNAELEKIHKGYMIL